MIGLLFLVFLVFGLFFFFLSFFLPRHPPTAPPCIIWRINMSTAPPPANMSTMGPPGAWPCRREKGGEMKSSAGETLHTMHHPAKGDKWTRRIGQRFIIFLFSFFFFLFFSFQTWGGQRERRQTWRQRGLLPPLLPPVLPVLPAAAAAAAAAGWPCLP